MKVNLINLSLLMLLVLISLAGCKTVSESKENQVMEAQLSLYGKTARWGVLENLYGFLNPEEGIKAVIPDNLDNVRVTDYQVRIHPMVLEEHKISQTVTIEYLFRDTQVIRTMSDSQIWAFDEESKQWFRANPVPDFK